MGISPAPVSIVAFAGAMCGYSSGLAVDHVDLAFWRPPEMGSWGGGEREVPGELLSAVYSRVAATEPSSPGPGVQHHYGVAVAQPEQERSRDLFIAQMSS